MAKVYTTTSTAINIITSWLGEIGRKFALNILKTSDQDKQLIMDVMKILHTIAGSDKAINNQLPLTNDRIAPHTTARYPTEDIVTVTINKTNADTAIEEMAKVLLGLVEKAERYDTLYTMKYEELKDLEARAYKEKVLRGKSDGKIS